MKTKTMILIGAGLGLGYYFLVASATRVVQFTAYDGTKQSVTVETSMPADVQQKIVSFFGQNGGMMNSTNPQGDVATLENNLRSAGYSKAAASVDSLYQTLLVNAKLSAQGFQAGYYGALAQFDGLRPRMG